MIQRVFLTSPLLPPSHRPVPAISACEKAGMWEKALELKDEMVENGVRPNEVTFNACISACARGGQFSQALTLLDELRRGEHGLSPSIIRWGGGGGGASRSASQPSPGPPT